MSARVGVDKWMFFTTLVLVVVGLAMVFSASAVVAEARYHSEFTDLGRQAGWALAGVLLMLALMHVDYSVYNSPRFIYSALCVTTILLVLVFFIPGSHNTHRWIRFGGHFTFQPSEIAKPVLVLFLAWFLHSRLDKMRDLKQTLLRAVIMPAVFILLIVKQPDLGTALVLFGVTAMVLVLAGMEWKYLLAGVVAMLPGLIALLFMVVQAIVEAPGGVAHSVGFGEAIDCQLPVGRSTGRQDKWRPENHGFTGVGEIVCRVGRAMGGVGPWDVCSADSIG